jgi:exopolysaccharide biosynthesis polyprenyl glycosylphosphotransferase
VFATRKDPGLMGAPDGSARAVPRQRARLQPAGRPLLAPRSGVRSARLVLMLAGDAAVSLGSLAAIVFIRRHFELRFTESLMPPEKFPLSLENCATVVLAFLIGLAMASFYDQRSEHRSQPAVAIAAAIQLSLVALAWTLRAEPLPRTVLVGLVVIEFPALLLWRWALRLVQGNHAEAVVLVGSVTGIRTFFGNLTSFRSQPVQIAGVVAPHDPGIDDVLYWGALDDAGVEQRVASAAELILISDDSVANQRLRLFALRGPRGFLMLPSAADAIALTSDFAWIGDQPVVEIAVRFGFGVAAIAKRAFDIAGATLLGVLSLPIWLTAAIAIAVESGRPVLLRQPRIGRGGVVYGMWKFRTMWREALGDTSKLARFRDPRITRIGRLLRRYRFDELPQLINVLRGEMSLVGPRPEQPVIAEAILREFPEFALRTMVRPGIAGLAQVSAEYHTSASVKLRYDLSYMRDWSFWLDLRILARTVSTVLSGRGL